MFFFYRGAWTKFGEPCLNLMLLQDNVREKLSHNFNDSARKMSTVKEPSG
jgi:hypothetical protein